MQDAALAVDYVEEDREQVVQAAGGKRIGDLESALREYVLSLVEEAVAAHSVTMEARHAGSDLECSVPVDARRLHPRVLVRHVIGHLVLEENVGSTVAVPDHLVFLEVLDEQAVCGHVVAVDDDACV